MKIFIINFLGFDYEEVSGNIKIVDYCKIQLETSLLFVAIFLSAMSLGYTDSATGMLYRERQLAICVILTILLIIVRTFKTIELINKLVATREVITAGKINGLYVIDSRSTNYDCEKRFLAFKTKETATRFLNEQKELLEIAKPLL